MSAWSGFEYENNSETGLPGALKQWGKAVDSLLMHLVSLLPAVAITVSFTQFISS